MTSQESAPSVPSAGADSATRVLVPYTTLHPLARRGLERFAPQAELVQIEARRVDDYWQLMVDAWGGERDLVIIEHDIEIHSGVLEAFDGCPSPWCSFPYQGAGWNTPGDSYIIAGLGCTRFTAELMAAVPDAVTAVASGIGDSPDLNSRDWRRLDTRLNHQLQRARPGWWRGLDVHPHAPPVRHHHVYQEGCACGVTHE